MDVTSTRRSAGAAGLWSKADFRRLWGADVISRLGDATTVLALPLAAIVALGSSPFEVGLIGVAQFAAAIVFGLPAGAWVDRLGRRKLTMIAADVGRAVSLATIPLAYAAGVLTIGQLLVVAAVNAALASFFDVASSAFVPELVGRPNLVEANAKLAMGRSAAEVGGPAIGGALIAVAGAPLAVAFDGVSFVVSAMTLRRVSIDDHGQPPGTTSGGTSLRRDISIGVRFVARQPYVRAVAVTACLGNLSRTVAFTVLLIYAIREAGLSPLAIGVAFAVGNVGFFVGGLTATRLTRRLGLGCAMVVAVLCFGPAMTLVLVAPAAQLAPAIGLMAFLNGLGIAFHGVNQISLRQAVTPARLLARVAAVTRLLIMGALPLGAAIGGILGSVIGLHQTMVIGTVGLYLMVIPYLVSPVHRLRSLPEPDEGHDPA